MARPVRPRRRTTPAALAAATTRQAVAAAATAEWWRWRTFGRRRSSLISFEKRFQQGGPQRPPFSVSCDRHRAVTAEHHPWVVAAYNQSVTGLTVKKVAEANFPTRWGQFRIYGFEGVSGRSTQRRGHARKRWKRPRRRGRAGHGRHPLRAAAGAHPFAVPHRRRVRLHALRLPPAARAGALDDRRSRRRYPHLRAAGGPRHRPDGQAPGLRAAGQRSRHGRGQRRAGLRQRLSRVQAARRRSCGS